MKRKQKPLLLTNEVVEPTKFEWMKKLKKLVVKIRRKYANLRGHHGKRWDYEPSENYMRRHKK